MPPSSPQLQQIYDALRGAFDRRALRELLVLRWSLDLDDIAGDKGLNDAVLTVVQHFNRAGRLNDLICAAREANGGNAALAELYACLLYTSPSPRD